MDSHSDGIGHDVLFGDHFGFDHEINIHFISVSVSCCFSRYWYNALTALFICFFENRCFVVLFLTKFVVQMMDRQFLPFQSLNDGDWSTENEADRSWIGSPSNALSLRQSSRYHVDALSTRIVTATANGLDALSHRSWCLRTNGVHRCWSQCPQCRC